MRILIARCIALLTVLQVSGCYTPSLQDCQFACGGGGACPEGTTCVDGFCRTTTSPSCVAPIDGALDAAVNCPSPPSNCNTPFVIPGNGCATTCMLQVTWDGADTACNGMWRLAILDSTQKLDAIIGTAGIHWVSARRTSGSVWRWDGGTGVIVADNLWSGPAPAGSGDSCAHFNTSDKRLANSGADCDDTESYLCTFP